MGSSTVTLLNVIDLIESMADLAPSARPGSYAAIAQLAIANDVLNDLIAQRFNWKWNSKLAPVFLTNTWQQDYPIIGLQDIGWLEESWWIDINSTARPIPTDTVTPLRDIAVQSGRMSGIPRNISWMAAKNMQIGSWPGANVTYNPLRTQSPIGNNPLMTMYDANGNILVLTTIGTTGSSAPSAAAKADEGTLVEDGSCVWTVCDPESAGFRLEPLPPGASPIYEIHNRYQRRAQKFTDLGATLDPIPDDYAQYFRRGYEAYCHKYSPDPKLRALFPGPSGLHAEWMQFMVQSEKQGDRESDGFALKPATQVVQPLPGYTRDPRNPARPW